MEILFYHPELKFQFAVPAGFGVANQPSAVILYNEAQNAITQFSIDGENSNPKSSVNAFTSQEGINLENQNEIVVNGYSGHTALVNTTTQDGTPVKIQVSAVSYDGKVYRFLSYTTSDQFSTYANDFSSVFTSFDAVDDPAVLNVQPMRIRLERVRQGGVFSELIPQNLPRGVDPLDVAILNQVNLDDRIERGAVLKIPAN